MYPRKLILGHLNINSVRNKYGSFQQNLLSKTDILLLSATKIDDSFLILNFSQKSSKGTVKIEPKPEEAFYST